MTAPTTTIRKGDRYWSREMATTITVTRVSRTGAWADIFVVADHTGITWSKRQPLMDGRFGFQAEQL